jgi:hypothetical protein
MSNSNALGTREFTGQGNDALVGASSSQEIWNTGFGNYTFGRGPNFTRPVPRFITCNIAGILVCTGWADSEIAVTRNLLAGQVLSFRPMSLTAAGTTAEIILEW